MTARAREGIRATMAWRLLRESGLPGQRWGDDELAQLCGVPRRLVQSWIESGKLRASRLRRPVGKGWWRIRRRAVRRAIADHPEIALAILEAEMRRGGA